MGTNFYWRSPVDDRLDRDGLHICKTSGPRSLTFEGYFGSHDDEDRRITSWEGWKLFLRDFVDHGRIEDETRLTYSVGEFVDLIEAYGWGDRDRQHRWMRDNRPDEVSEKPSRWMSWLDPDGFSFSGREFT